MNFIYENNNSICNELCDEIIEMYENENHKYCGKIDNGIINKDIRDSTEFVIPNNNKKWNNIEQFLYKELHNNLLKYIEKINCSSYKSDFNLLPNCSIKANFVETHSINNNTIDNMPPFHPLKGLSGSSVAQESNELLSNERVNKEYSIFNNTTLEVDSFTINRYEKNKGKYVYHNDFSIDFHNLKYRVISFIWYLNTVNEGGETEFWDSYKIKPNTGKLVIFPSNWCFKHRELMPITDNKYIIEGWFYKR